MVGLGVKASSPLATEQLLRRMWMFLPAVLPSFIKTPRDSTIRTGHTARLECAAEGHPAPQIAWQKDGGTDFPAARERRMHVMPDDDVFFIMDVKPEDMGLYSCTARNTAGTVSANATLTVLGKDARLATACKGWKWQPAHEHTHEHAQSAGSSGLHWFRARLQNESIFLSVQLWLRCRSRSKGQRSGQGWGDLTEGHLWSIPTPLLSVGGNVTPVHCRPRCSQFIGCFTLLNQTKRSCDPITIAGHTSALSSWKWRHHQQARHTRLPGLLGFGGGTAS